MIRFNYKVLNQPKPSALRRLGSIGIITGTAFVAELASLATVLLLAGFFFIVYMIIFNEIDYMIINGLGIVALTVITLIIIAQVFFPKILIRTKKD